MDSAYRFHHLMFVLLHGGSAFPPSSGFSTKTPRQENIHTSDADANKASSILSYCTFDLIR